LKEQDVVLEKSIALAKQFKTDKIRCFDFWRRSKMWRHTARPIDRKLAEAAGCVRKTGNHTGA